jgi:hypothetical protein
MLLRQHSVKVSLNKVIYKKHLFCYNAERCFFILGAKLLHPDLNDNEFDLTMYVPTKGRPENALRLQDQFYRTINLNSRIVFINSDNDQKLEHYKHLHEQIIVSPKKPGFVDPLNLGYTYDRKRVFSYAVGFMGDDHFPRTEGWDEIFVNNLLEMKAGLVYGNDGFQGAKIPTQIAMTWEIPLHLGFMTLPQLQHLYADNFWLDFGIAINKLRYIPDVLIEHLHPAAGKAQVDAGYEYSSNYLLDQQDKATYQRYLSEDLEGDAQEVLGMLRRSHKL